MRLFYCCTHRIICKSLIVFKVSITWMFFFFSFPGFLLCFWFSLSFLSWDSAVTPSSGIVLCTCPQRSHLQSWLQQATYSQSCIFSLDRCPDLPVEVYNFLPGTSHWTTTSGISMFTRPNMHDFHPQCVPSTGLFPGSFWKWSLTCSRFRNWILFIVWT